MNVRIYLNGRFVEEFFAESFETREEVKEHLIEEGYDKNIIVKRVFYVSS